MAELKHSICRIADLVSQFLLKVNNISVGIPFLLMTILIKSSKSGKSHVYTYVSPFLSAQKLKLFFKLAEHLETLVFVTSTQCVLHQIEICLIQLNFKQMVLPSLRYEYKDQNLVK